MDILRDERGLIVSWLVKILLVVAILGVVIYDGARIGMNHFGLDEDARDIAVTISDSVDATSRFNQAPLILRAREMAEEVDARLVSLNINEQGVVEVQLRRRAETLVVERIGPIKDWARSTASGTATSN